MGARAQHVAGRPPGSEIEVYACPAYSLHVCNENPRLEAEVEEDARRAEVAAELDQCVGEASPSLEKPICTKCGTYRQLAFRDGTECMELCPCDRVSKRRRLHYKQSDRWGLFDTIEEGISA